MAKAQGFSRDERVLHRAEFDRAFQQGTRRRGRHLTVHCVPNGLEPARLGIALARGWSGAVARNRAKRLVREAFRTHKGELPKGLDIVVVPRTNWAEPSVNDVAAELVRLVGAMAEGRR